jgi:hypothetical protein
LSETQTVAITGAPVFSKTSANCLEADFSPSTKSSQNKTKNGSSQIKFFALKIASPSHFG